MVSLDQIRVLEQKVGGAVSRIEKLNADNLSLQQRCSQLEEENESLRLKLSAFEKDQEKIEQGIINALDRLNTVENSILLSAGVFQQEYPAATDNFHNAQNTFNEENASMAQDSSDVSEPQEGYHGHEESVSSSSPTMFSEQQGDEQLNAFDIF